MTMILSGRRCFMGSLGIALALSLWPTTAITQGGGNPNAGRVIPSNQYQRLAAAWWQYVFSLPVAENPLVDQTGANALNGQPFVNGNVIFLVGLFNGGSAERSITISAGTQLFLPLINSWCDNLGVDPPMTVDQLRACAAGFIDSTTELHATLDGIPLQGLFGYRAKSEVFCYNLPAENNLIQFFFNFPASGQVCPAVADGYWLLLNPLRLGEHTLTFSATADPSFSSEITYQITVVPGRAQQ